MQYVDGFLLPVPTKKMKEYLKLARWASKAWRKHGALEYRECIGEDLAVKMGLPFTKAVKAKRGETVVFSWIVYKSRAHRDQVNKKVMADPKMLEMCKKPMPFDMKRMYYGGFEIAVKA